MERITFEGNFCDIAQCANVPGGSFCEDGFCLQRKAWERLKEYENAEEQGRLVMLPCHTGRTVYILDGKKINRCIVENTLVRNGLMARMMETSKNIRYAIYPKNMGKTVFLTRQEAEKALEGMKNVN